MCVRIIVKVNVYEFIWVHEFMSYLLMAFNAMGFNITLNFLYSDINNNIDGY